MVVLVVIVNMVVVLVFVLELLFPGALPLRLPGSVDIYDYHIYIFLFIYIYINR